MNTVSSNVYYLARPAAVESAPPAPIRPGHVARLRRAWWRFRFVTAELWYTLRRGGRHLFEDEGTFVLAESAEVVERPRRTTPARVLDFEAARARLRAPARD
jgi:hypothetical protein